MNIDFESLGFTKEELQERVVEKIVDSLNTHRYLDEDGDEHEKRSKFFLLLKERVKSRVDSKVDELAEKFVLPKVSECIDNITIQKTNEYGEKKGESVTFIEYLVSRAESYMQEYVDSDGKRLGNQSYRRDPEQTRITQLVDRYLHTHIENSMRESLKIALGEIAKGIHETARIKLNQIAESMKISISTK